MFVQAVVYCTRGRARKVVVALTIASLIWSAISVRVLFSLSERALMDMYAVLFLILPLSILVINVLVVREVRRASNAASTNLGLQQSPQTTSSNSAVPTLMLITTSLIYVFLTCTWSFCHFCVYWLRGHNPGGFDDESKLLFSVNYLQRLIFVYNFFVYLITGRQFRSELRSLCCRPTSAADAGGNDAARSPRSGRRFATSRV